MSIKLNFYKTALLKKSKKGFQGFPVATVAFYGPNDRVASKVVVGIEEAEDSEPSVVRWHSPATDVRRNADVLEEIVKLIRRRDVKSLAMVETILGCPHEEGVDYPEDEVCPECPFWADRPRPIVDNEHPPVSRPMFPNLRAMEKTIAGITSAPQATTSLEKAQQIMWDAWDEPNPRRRIELAKKALAISEDCADDFVLLGRKPMPRSMPPQYAIGSRDEAIIYTDAHRDHWRKSNGAMEWLKRESTAAPASAD